MTLFPFKVVFWGTWSSEFNKSLRDTIQPMGSCWHSSAKSYPHLINFSCVNSMIVYLGLLFPLGLRFVFVENWFSPQEVLKGEEGGARCSLSSMRIMWFPRLVLLKRSCAHKSPKDYVKKQVLNAVDLYWAWDLAFLTSWCCWPTEHQGSRYRIHGRHMCLHRENKNYVWEVSKLQLCTS